MVYYKDNAAWPSLITAIDRGWLVKISVVHHSFHVAGGSEKVTFSLLEALDRTGHDTELRCVRPPAGVRFSGEPAQGKRREQDERDWGAQPPPKFNKVRLTQIPEGGAGDRIPNFGAEVRALFGNTESDLLIVTDGGFIWDRTDAARILVYGNSDLSVEAEVLHRRCPRSPLRSPLRALRLRLEQAAFRKTMAALRDGRAVAIPNTKSTARSYARLFGRDSMERVVYPPVDLDRFRALRGSPKEDRVATTGRFAPEKNHEMAARVMHRVGARWDAVGNTKDSLYEEHLAMLQKMVGSNMHLHVNAGEDELDRVLGGARVYLHARPESFGIAVVEAAAAGCVPVVPDNSAHPETVPFGELRYATEDEAVDKVREALDGSHDRLLPGLARHAERFSVRTFQEAMLGIIEGQVP